MVVSELAHLDMQVTIKEDAYSYQDAVNEATNDAVKKIESILRQQYVVGDEYQDITETPEALEIIQLLRVLLEGYKGPSRGCGCEDIIDEIVAWFKDQVKTCHSLNEVRSALEEDFFWLAWLPLDPFISTLGVLSIELVFLSGNFVKQ